MLLELIATLFAGLGAAGLALAARKLSAGRLPRWLVPACAGIGMLGFQIYSEYNWFNHQVGLLPEEVVVVKTVTQARPWQPWSYVVPQVSRFMALDKRSLVANQNNPQLMLVDLYTFERRHAAQRVRQVFHCGKGARANFSEDLQVPAPGEALSEQWVVLPPNDELLKHACA